MPVLADLAIGGQPRKVVMVANRNGFFYVLDRVTGKVLLGKPFTDTTWAQGARSRRPSDRPQRRQQGMSAGSSGAARTSCRPLSIPRCGLFFVTARETCATYLPEKQVIAPGGLA